MATFTNQATLTYNGNVANSNIVTGEVVEVLTATKTSLSDSYTGTQELTYVVNLTNSGTTAINGLTVTDNLGEYTFSTLQLVPLSYVDGSLRYFINGVLQTAPTVTAGPPLTVTGINIPADSNAMLIYRAVANEFAPLSDGSTITNTVTVTGGGLSTPVTATEAVAISTESRLEITKALSPAVVNENGEITYTLTILNYSTVPAIATDNASVTDTFTPILNPITVNFNGAPWVETTNYTYDTTTGVFTTVPGQITVPAATTVQNPDTGVWTITPGSSVLVITGTV